MGKLKDRLRLHEVDCSTTVLFQFSVYVRSIIAAEPPSRMIHRKLPRIPEFTEARVQ